MKRAHPFRFKRIRRKNGRVYQVIYDHDPAHPVSTGIPVHPRDTATDGPGMQEAIAWAYANLDNGTHTTVTFREATAEFFTEQCRWRRRLVSKGRTFAPTYFPQHRSRLTHYLWPRWGAQQPSAIQPYQIDDWLVEIETPRGAPASAGLLNKILQTFRIVLDELEYRNIIEKNPARLVSYYLDDDVKRLPITLEEFGKLFPQDVDALIHIWGSLKWAAFFYIMATTGMRPGEVAAFDLSYWEPGVGAAIHQAIDPTTREIKGLKTAARGVAVKPAYLNQRAENLLTMAVYNGLPQSGLAFTVNGQAIIPETSNKHFKASAARAGVTLGTRTQYSLRHFYATEMAKHLPEKDVAEYLGQRVMRSEYDHRRVMERLRENEPLRAVTNSIFG